MIRVLHIFHNMGNGGIEHFVMDIYRRIDRNKIQFDFLTSVNEPGYFDEEIESLGGRLLHAYPFKKNPIKNYISISNIVKDNHYRIVHRHTGSAFGYFDLRAARRGGADRLILHSHNPQPGNAFIHSISKFFLQFDCIKLACSNEAGDFLYGKKAHYTVVKNGIDCDRFRFNPDFRKKVRSNLRINNRYVIGHIGRFEEQKNHKKLIDVFREIYLKKPDSVLVCIGDGSLIESMKDYAEQLGISASICFLGNRSDVDILINSFDVFCFPSLYEGFSITQIEAQANGLKCFTSEDKVPAESNITGNVTFIPLSASDREWANIILKGDIKRDLNAVNKIKEAGYDIAQTTNMIEEIYLG